MERVLVSHSSRMFFNQCHKKYYWTQVERLEPKMPAMPLLRGVAGHKLADEWSRDKSRADELAEKVRALYPDLYGGLKEYFRKYHTNDVVYVLPSQSFAVYLCTQDNIEYFYTGETDGLVESRGSLWVLERKFTSRIPSDMIAQFQLDDQTRGYAWFHTHRNEKVAGALVDITRVTKYPECVREYINISVDALNQFYEDLMDTVVEIHHARQSSRFPMSPHSCFMMGECPMRLLCLNPDRAKLAESMGYYRREVSHEEEVFERAIS